MTTLTATNRVPVATLVARLRALPPSAFENIEQIRSLLAEFPVDESSLAPYLTWSQHYTRNLIDKTDLYELLAICWEVGGQFRPQSSRPELLDGHPHRLLARRKFSSRISGHRRRNLSPHRI